MLLHTYIIHYMHYHYIYLCYFNIKQYLIEV